MASSNYNNSRLNASTSSSSSSSSRLPCLHQIVALSLTYRRMVTLSVMGPVAAAFVLPLVTGVMMSPTIMIAMPLFTIFTKGSYELIYRLSPTQKSLQVSLAKNRLWLPFSMAVIALACSRSISSPWLYRWWSGFFAWFPLQPLSFKTGLYLALIVTLLQLAIIPRYIGPSSIKRCSTFPLISNPLESHLRYLMHHPLSLLEPSDVPGQLFVTSPVLALAQHGVTMGMNNNNHNIGRRFQRPTFATTLAQVVLTSLISLVVVLVRSRMMMTTTTTTTIGINDDDDDDSDEQRSVFMMMIILTTLSTLFATLDGVSHEIDPSGRVYDLSDRSSSSSSPSTLLQHRAMACCGERARTAMGSAILITILSCLFCYLFLSDSNKSAVYWMLSCPRLTLISAAMNMYMMIFDETLCMALFYKVDVKQSVAEFDDDTTNVACLDVILHSLLFSSEQLVKEVWTPTRQTKAVVLNLLSEETARAEHLMQHLGTIMLSGKPIHAAAEAPLEEDVMRINILESFGGTDDDARNRRPRPSAKQQRSRHDVTIDQWLDCRSPKGRSILEPLTVPLVRSLCAFAGGLGEALLQSQSHSRARQKRQRHLHIETTWIVPPGALAAGQFAITAASRFIVRGLRGVAGRPIADWKSSHLSMLVPAALLATFRLRCGILAFGQKHAAVQTCDNVAVDILDLLKRPRDPLNALDLPLDEGCLAWLYEVHS